jgi:hypothetical protein
MSAGSRKEGTHMMQVFRNPYTPPPINALTIPVPVIPPQAPPQAEIKARDKTNGTNGDLPDNQGEAQD